MDTKINDRFVASSVLIMKDIKSKVGNRKKDEELRFRSTKGNHLKTGESGETNKKDKQ